MLHNRAAKLQTSFVPSNMCNHKKVHPEIVFHYSWTEWNEIGL